MFEILIFRLRSESKIQFAFFAREARRRNTLKREL